MYVPEKYTFSGLSLFCTPDQFKLMLEMYPEYLLLFHERENAGLSSSAALSAPLDIGSSTQKQHKVVIEVKEVAEPCVTIKKV